MSLEIRYATEKIVEKEFCEEGKHLLVVLFKLSYDCSRLLRPLINELQQLHGN